MKKLILAVSLLAASVSANATMIRTFLISAQVEGIVVCQAATSYALTQNPNVTLEETLKVVVPVRHKVNQEGDSVKAGTPEDNLLDTVDHEAWYFGSDLVKKGNIKDQKKLDDICVYAALSNVKHMALKMNAKDFIDQNPQVFDGIE